MYVKLTMAKDSVGVAGIGVYIRATSIDCVYPKADGTCTVIGMTPNTSLHVAETAEQVMELVTKALRAMQ